MRTAIATVCLSGSLVEKLHACAAAGFDGVEIFEPDLVVADESPEEIRALADRLGLGLDLYQPFRDAEGVDEATMTANLRRAEAKFALMQRLGMDLMLVCSNVATATVDSDEVSANQLSRLGDLAGEYGVRLAYEALAWGTFVSDYRRAWRIVERADHPQVGVCLDSFHILSRGHDTTQIATIPGDKIFFLQLADAPPLSMDVLSWSRHHRLFPGEGAWDLGDFVARVLAAGYAGPLSLEVFNDVYRQTDPVRTAAHAHRSLTWVADQAARVSAASLSPRSQVPRLTDAAPPTGVDFVEVKAENTGGWEDLLDRLGFTFRGRHRTKPVTLWTAGDAKVVLNEQHARDEAPHLAAVGFTVPDVSASLARARELGAPPVYRRTSTSEVDLRAVAAPDGTEIFLHEPTRSDADWVAEFEHGLPADSTGCGAEAMIIGVDHVNLVQPWQDFDEAILFYSSVLGLSTAPGTEVAGPRGLVRSQVVHTDGGAVRIPLNVVPPVLDEAGLPQHVAFACRDVVALARRAREHGLTFLPVPDNYYEDLTARFDLDPERLDELRDLDLLYDRDRHGEFVHFYTITLGEVFMEFVERRGGYDGYGAPNAPIRLAAQRRLG